MTFFPKPIKKISKTGSYVGGIWEDGVESVSEIQGSVQPLTAKEVLALDIGERATGLVWVFTDALLVASAVGSNDPGDEIVFLGNRYLVRKHDPFTNLIVHNRYRAEYRGPE